MTVSIRSAASSVAEALEAVEILSPIGYRWLGEAFEVPERAVRHAAPDARREALVQGIKWRLHSDYFVTGGPVPARRPVSTAGPRRALSHRLAAANAGTGSLDHGWRLVGRDGERLVVERPHLRLWARPDEVMAEGPGPPNPGDDVLLRLPSEMPEFSPGFYMALGDHGFSAQIPRLLDRFYYNLREDGAVAFMEHVTRRLNAAAVPYRAKVVDEPGGFDRCDSALLVFERRDRLRAAREAIAIQSALDDVLDAETPALTRTLAPGLAFAEDPGGGESFGAQRCRLIAEAVVRASELGVADLTGRLDVVRERFAAAGTSLEAPHLGPDSPGDLDLSNADFRMEGGIPCR